MENYVNRPLSDKSMKFGIMVVHYLTNDITYNAKLNRSNISNFFVALFVLSLCPFDISVGVGAFVIGLSQISSFLSV